VGNNYRSTASSPPRDLDVGSAGRLTRIKDGSGSRVPFRSREARSQACSPSMAPGQPSHGTVADHAEVSPVAKSLGNPRQTKRAGGRRALLPHPGGGSRWASAHRR